MPSHTARIGYPSSLLILKRSWSVILLTKKGEPILLDRAPLMQTLSYSTYVYTTWAFVNAAVQQQPTQVVDGAEFAFPRRTAALHKSGEYEKVFALKARIEKEAGIKIYIAEGRRQPFSLGLFRHYPELDGDE